MTEKDFKPFISADQSIAEFSAKAVILGIILTIVMTAANTYLGLYAGMTVSASIPAAVISMAILRGLLRKGTILENNIVQTIASAGESLAAGIIFTIPALVLVGAWNDFKFWPTTLIAISGGLLGIVFMVPLRRALIIEEKELTYPEGVACAEVLKAGEVGGGSFMAIFYGLGLGALFKFFTTGVKLLKGSVETAFFGGHRVFFFGSDMSPALLAVGYIVKIEIAFLVFLGGVIAWVICIPILGIGPEMGNMSALDIGWALWSEKIRYMGVGAMIIGGLWSIWGVRKGMSKGFKSLKKGRDVAAQSSCNRLMINMKMFHMLIILALTVVIMFFLYDYFTKMLGVAVLTTLLMIIASFFFVAVSSYIVGLVGSSNNPVSGMTICTLLGVSALFLVLGLKGDYAILATLGIAGVVCCAACSAGDCSQDLKTGYIVGATPVKQQWGQVIGIIAPAFIIAPILTLLHQAYGIGQGLKAPQATLFASITEGMFGKGHIPKDMIVYGLFIGIALVVLDEILKRSKINLRMHVMPVAIGIYLPITLGTPIFIGGLVRYFVDKARKSASMPEAQDKGILLSSGLIAGEAIMGILLAIIIVAKINMEIKVPDMFSEILSIVLFLAVALYIGIAAKSGNKKT